MPGPGCLVALDFDGRVDGKMRRKSEALRIPRLGFGDRLRSLDHACADLPCCVLGEQLSELIQPTRLLPDVGENAILLLEFLDLFDVLHDAYSAFERPQSFFDVHGFLPLESYCEIRSIPRATSYEPPGWFGRRGRPVKSRATVHPLAERAQARG